MSILKRLLEGRMYAYLVKGLSGKLIQFKGPIVFISNYNDVIENTFVNRLKFVHADVDVRTGKRRLYRKRKSRTLRRRLFFSSDEERSSSVQVSQVTDFELADEVDMEV